MTGAPDPGAVQVEVWPARNGNLYFPLIDGVPPQSAATSVLAQVPPGSAVVAPDPGLRDTLLERGARQVRHLFAMRRDLADLPAAPELADVVLRAWQDGDPERLPPALIAAYPPAHPNPVTPDPAAAAQSLRETAGDPDNPRLRATTVAEVGGRPAGAALVLDSRHVTGWKGPWVMNVFRDPALGPPGVGRAMLVRALDVLRADGESTVGLAVTATNPARHVYERLGFTYGFEGWVLVVPAVGASGR